MDIAYNLRSAVPKYYAFSVTQKRFDDAGAKAQVMELSQEEKEMRDIIEKRRAKYKRKTKRSRKKRAMPLHMQKSKGSRLDDLMATKEDIPGAGSYDLPPLPRLGSKIGFTEETRLREDADSTWYGAPQVNDYKKMAKFPDPSKLNSKFITKSSPDLLSPG